MKKYLFNILPLLLFLVFSSSVSAQWILKSNTDNGKYSLVTNSGTFFGVSAAGIHSETILSLTPSDTSAWRLVTNTDNGMYSLAENKISFMGIDSGKIRTKAVYILNPATLTSLGLDTNKLAYIGKSNSFIGRKQTFDTVNATVKYLLNGNDINTGGTLSNVAYLNQSNIFGGITIVNAPSLTGSSSTPIYDISQTWNTTGAPTAFKVNITSTASSTSSLLMDLQIGGGSVFSVRKDGRVTAGTIISQSDITAGANNGITFTGRTQLSAPTGGSLLIVNTSGGTGATINAGNHLPTVLNTFSLGTSSLYYTTVYVNNSSSKDTTLTASTTITTAFPEKILIDASSGDVTLTLPNTAALKNYNYRIKRIDNSGSTVMLSTDGSIDDEPTKTLDYNMGCTISCTGSGIYKTF